MSILPLARNNEIVIQELKAEVLIYDLRIDKAFCLNEMSAGVWHLCDGTKTVSEISRLMSLQMKSTVTEDVVRFAISELKKEGLMIHVGAADNPFQGKSRREIIKTIGLATMVALPVISGLVAPKSIQAASGLCAGKICDDHSLCTTNDCDPTTGDCIFTVIDCPPPADICTSVGCQTATGCFSAPILCPQGQTCSVAAGGCVPIPR